MMADIIPFRGVLYNEEKVKDLAKVFCPPYDVISSQGQLRYYNMHEYNIVRIVLGQSLPGDNKENNPYTRAGGFFADWLKEGILKKDEAPAIYIYGQEYIHNGKKKKRYGFIALLKIEDAEKKLVLPHEATFSKPREDRLNLMRATGANCSSVFSLFFDEKREIGNTLKAQAKHNAPIIDVEQDGIKYRLWRLTDTKIIEKIKGAMRSGQIFIADGHHRYEAALNFRNEMRARGKDKEDAPYNYVMMYFTSLNSPDLTILPTHRVVRNVSGFNSKKLEKMLSRYFEMRLCRSKQEMLSLMAKGSKAEHIFGMYHGGKKYFFLRLKDKEIMERIAGSHISKESRQLDVTVFQELILEHILGVKGRLSEKNIGYTRDADEAVRFVDREKYQAAFFVNPIRIDQVRDIARAGERMPQKSTHFYPKLLTGLVMNKMSTSLSE